MEFLQICELFRLLRLFLPGLRDPFGPEADHADTARSELARKFIVSASIAVP